MNHKENEYVRADFRNNNSEGFWSSLKRGIYGIYHKVSVKLLCCYRDEFTD